MAWDVNLYLVTSLVLFITGLVIFFSGIFRGLKEIKEDISSGKFSVLSFRKLQITELLFLLSGSIAIIVAMLVLAYGYDIWVFYFSIAILVMTVIASFLTLQQVAQGVSIWKSMAMTMTEMMTAGFGFKLGLLILGNILWIVIAVIVVFYPLVTPLALLLVGHVVLGILLAFITMWIMRKLAESI